MFKHFAFLSAFIILSLLTSEVHSQTCSPVDSLKDTTVAPGFYPQNGTLPCFIKNGPPSSVVINFKNFEQVTISGTQATVDWIEFNSIDNLPCGLTWTTNKENSPDSNRFQENEVGCIEISGATDDSVGQYRLKFDIDAKVEVNGQPLGPVDTVVRALGIRYDMRVKADSNASCPALDTTKTGQMACDGPDVTKTEEKQALRDVTITPNPFIGSTKLNIHADEAGKYTLRVHSLLGETVRQEKVRLSAGANRIPFKQKDLSGGIYLLQLTNGRQTKAKKLMIQDQ